MTSHTRTLAAPGSPRSPDGTASRFVATLLFGLEPGDPVTLIAAAVALAVIGAVAGWLPAHRESCLDSARVLSEI